MDDNLTLTHVDFWDVGQGDCSVIHLSDGSLIIIDVGPKNSPLITWLHGKTNVIRYILLTHNDADHAGALSSLVADHGDRVGHIWMLLDRAKDNPKFKALFNCADAWAIKTGREIKTIVSGQSLWRSAGQGLEVKIVHPSFSELIKADGPNKSSAMVVIESKDGWLKAWPGDLELETVVTKCAGKSVHSMVGPHHGAPQDVLTKGGKVNYRASVGAEALKLKRAFLSVGSTNNFKHPNPSYVFSLAKAGTHVVCSQVTKVCDHKHCTSRRPVFDGSGMLALPSAPTGVACRGTRRVTFMGDQVLPDKFAMQHLLAVAELETPLCLKGRGWIKGQDVTLP